MNSIKTERILHVFSSLNKGGAESRIVDIYRAIDRNVVQFDYAVTSPNIEKQYYYSEILKMGGSVFEIQPWRRLGLFQYYKQWKNILKRQYKCIHTHNGIGGGVALFIAWINRIPVRIAHARHSGKIENINSRYKYYILRMATNLFSNIKLYCSKEAAKYLFFRKYLDSTEMYFLPNAITMDSFCNVSSENIKKIQIELKTQKYTYIIGTVGNARPVKNHIFLVKVFEQFLKLEPDSLLLIVGDSQQDGEAKGYVKEHNLSSNVAFLGPRDDIAELLQVMDLFVLPSLSEGAPGSVIEAQAMNIPCILSDTITRAVDAHAGLVEYISLEASLDEWAEKMLLRIKKEKPDISETRRLLRYYGYDVSTSAEKLLKIYGIS